MARILIVEDSDLIREAVTEAFSVSGHTPTSVATVKDAVEALATSGFEAVILDIRLPDGNGYKLAQKIRETSSVPIIFLTAKDSESERVMGFEVGADDYVVKPFSAKELLLRLEAILRRGRSAQTDPDGARRLWHLHGHTLVIDESAHLVELDGERVHVTESEWRILTELVTNEGQAITREHILSECLDRPYDGAERTVDTHIGNIRALLGEAEWIETVRGYGYRFVGERAHSPPPGDEGSGTKQDER
ncbi:MAG: response regulator transcription factor [Spirochaetota bacterium]